MRVIDHRETVVIRVIGRREMVVMLVTGRRVVVRLVLVAAAMADRRRGAMIVTNPGVV